MIPGPRRSAPTGRSGLVTCSTPGMARAARKPSHQPRRRAHVASRRVSQVPGRRPSPALPGPGAAPGRARSPAGCGPRTAHARVELPDTGKPLANATSVIGMLVSASSRRAVCNRAVRARACGPRPARPRAAGADAAGDRQPRSQAADPVGIDVAVRDQPHRPAARSARTFHSGDPGLASGRHLRQARKFTASAVAACAKNPCCPGPGSAPGRSRSRCRCW